MTSDHAVLLLRLAGPLQSWGSGSEFNRRDTRPEPTKSGVIGLLAAAQGRDRRDEIADLLDLSLGIRVDQLGTVLRDYHTVSDYRGVPLLSASVNAKGAQKPTSPAKRTQVTQRYYLQDAVFVAGIYGPRPIIDTLEAAVRTPAFPLALGRRSCVPTGPMVIDVREGKLKGALSELPWQASEHTRSRTWSSTIDLPVTIDDRGGEDTVFDVPTSFNPLTRVFTSRRVQHGWVTVSTGIDGADDQAGGHDPYTLLGW
jgi:CRISPR system Cascade subunit CasD